MDARDHGIVRVARVLLNAPAAINMEATFQSPTGLVQVVRVGRLSVFLLVGTLSDERWQAMLDWSAVALAECRGTLALLPEGHVTPRQRGLSARQRPGETSRVCVITDSPLLRGTLTAYSWLKRGEITHAAFAPNEIDRALVWLADGVTFDANEARAAVRRLERIASAGIPKTGSA